MSTTLLTADNISVKGHHYKVRTYNHLPNPSGPHIFGDPQTTSESDNTESDAVHLDFTLLINGKLKTFGWSFIIEDGKKLGHDWTLSQWSDWNAIYFILWNLGYQIDDRETSFGQEQLHKWLTKLMNGSQLISRVVPRDFYYPKNLLIYGIKFVYLIRKLSFN